MIDSTELQHYPQFRLICLTFEQLNLEPYQFFIFIFLICSYKNRTEKIQIFFV